MLLYLETIQDMPIVTLRKKICIFLRSCLPEIEGPGLPGGIDCLKICCLATAYARHRHTDVKAISIAECQNCRFFLENLKVKVWTLATVAPLT